jgi:hypothetical protein
MKKEILGSIELERRTLWCQVVVAYVQASNSTSCAGAISWADSILKEFDKKFNFTNKLENEVA